MKTILLILINLSTFTLIGQNTATWVGGTPGNPTDWHEAKNWSTGEVPDSETHVIINMTNSGHNSMPVVAEDAEALWIEINHSATLEIAENAELFINGSYGYTEGINLYGGEIINKGTVLLSQLDEDIDDETLAALSTGGNVFVDGDVYVHR